MADTNIAYGKFGIGTFEKEIRAQLGDEIWNALAMGGTLPDIETECNCQCRNMASFLRRFEATTDAATVKRILCAVRHGLQRSQSAWAREEFLQTGDLDAFLKAHLERERSHFKELNREKKDFYGQDITDEALAYILANPSMMSPVREGNKLHCMAFPNNIAAYLEAKDSKTKRYHACHCPFAKESILSDAPVPSILCNCSLGHVMNFAEAFLDRSLEGRVLSSVLNGDLTCEYEIAIPDDIMEKYVHV